MAGATSTGDILEVSSYGSGIFRLRVGPNTRPDYGIVVGRAKACAVASDTPGTWTFTAGDAAPPRPRVDAPDGRLRPRARDVRCGWG